MTTTTTNTTVSTSFIFSKEDALFIIQAFKARARAKNVSAVDMVIYNLARGKCASAGFTPLRHPAKIRSNGNDPWNGYTLACRSVMSHLNYGTGASLFKHYLESKPGMFTDHKQLLIAALRAVPSDK